MLLDALFPSPRSIDDLDSLNALAFFGCSRCGKETDTMWMGEANLSFCKKCQKDHPDECNEIFAKAVDAVREQEQLEEFDRATDHLRS